MKPFQLLPLFLRREPTTDSALADYCKALGRPIPRKLDVVAYASLDDAKAKHQKARWNWANSRKPRRRRDTVTLNCYQWQVCWLPDL